MENRELQNWNLQPIPGSGRQWKRNPQVFLKANVIQASSQLNPDKDKKFWFPGQPLPDPNFGQENVETKFMFGVHQELTPNPYFSQNGFGKNPAIPYSPISTSLVFQSGKTMQLSILSHTPDLERSRPSRSFQLEIKSSPVKGKFWASTYSVFLVQVEAQKVPMIVHQHQL